MLLIDSHCHLDDPRFDTDRARVLAHAREAGVVAMVVPGIVRDDWPRLRATCRADPGLHPAYGLHPMFLDRHQGDDLEELERWLLREPAVAVGECGLDFHIPDPRPDEQRALFEAQVALAVRLDLPLIVHARKALDAVLQILRRHPGCRGVLHSFSGSPEQARHALGLGFLFGFGGAVTHDRATRLHRLVATLPLTALLLETDAPYQPDAGIRGQRNEPARLAAILEAVAALRGEPAGTIARATTENACDLFGLTLPAR